jgi:hypothetical protein
MHVDLPEWRVAHGDELMRFTGADDEDVSRTGVALFAVHGPVRVSFDHINNLVVTMVVETWSTTGLGDNDEPRDRDASVVSADEFVSGSNEGKLGLREGFHTYSFDDG